ncbi:MAG: hypothetical protein JXJ22_01460 [Bacteroidales bacterium]|nr:hypothetical protein [Bacteroidales bacterium]
MRQISISFILVCSFILTTCKKENNEPETTYELTTVIHARGETGTETIRLLVGSIQVKSWTLTTDFQEYTAYSDSGIVRVYFTNAGGNRAVQIDYATLNESVFESENQPVNTAVFQNDICGGAYSEWMNCSGYIQFDNLNAQNVIIRNNADRIDLTDTRQIIRGFGGATVFRPTVPLTSEELDLLFGNEDGQIGLSILRIRVVSDDDSYWRGVELSNAQGAVARGAAVVASPWSPPIRMKTNTDLTGGSLKPDSYADYATYLNNFAEYMAANNAPLYAISIQNEPDIQVDYESCDWTSAQMRDFLKNHGSVISATKVIAPESYNFNHNFSDPILNDSEAEANVDIIGGHIYGSGLADYPLAREKGKEVWMTEHLDTDTLWNAVFATGKEIHDCMAIGNFSAYIWWYAKRFYGPLSETNYITKRGYIMSNYSKFVRPGYYRVNATVSPSSDIFVSAYKGDKTVIVAINMSNSVVEQQFVFENGTVAGVIPYITTQTENLSMKGMVTVIENTFTYPLPPQSITTFVQHQ